MYNIISVTNRKLCSDFKEQIKKIAYYGIDIVLREKDLTETEYEKLAKEVMEICPDVILHSFIGVAKKLGCKKIHLPLHIFRENPDITEDFVMIGVSTHSIAEAKEAQSLGASYITAGHIFETDCKKGVPPKGLDFLKELCGAVKIPVYAIGGVTPKNASLAIDNGAYGVCIMSGLMKCNNIDKYLLEM